MNKTLLLIPVLVLVFFVSVPDAFSQKTIAKNMEITLNSAGYGSVNDSINQCGEYFQFSFVINPGDDRVYYDWNGVQEIKCDGISYKFHHVFLEVWEGKADNIRDLHEMHYSQKIQPPRESKDYSRLIDPFDTLGLRAAFIFTEEKSK